MRETVPDRIRAATFDHIIVGGGTAGCIVSARLSEQPQRKILLIEAGKDYPPGSEPRSVADAYPRSYGDPSFFWPDLVAEVRRESAPGGQIVERRFEQARIMGGGSSIHGMVALRGLPADYDEWPTLGAEGWGWQDVLPYFKRLETDLDFGGPLHGDSGPIPIRRQLPPQWAPFTRAVAQTWRTEGFSDFADANADFRDGISSTPMSNSVAGRVSSATGYLTREVRRRPNLMLLDQAYVRRILFEGTRATGVEVTRGGETVMLRAREVILSAGGIHSPAILLRSGVGPADALRASGVDVVADLPPVGANLQNHPLIYVATHLKSRSVQPASVHAWGQAWLRYSSGHADCPAGDMAMFAVNKSAWHPLGRRIGAISVSPYKSFSSGSVRLRAADPFAAPEVRFGLLSDERDLDRMASGLGDCFRTFASPIVSATRNEVFLPDPLLVKRLNWPKPSSWAISAAINMALNLVPTLRSSMLGRMALDVEKLAGDTMALRELALARAGPAGHVIGTCRLGAPDAPDAVVDPACRVRRITGVRVVDGSIIPAMVCANTNLPITMVAERAADRIKETG